MEDLGARKGSRQTKGRQGSSRAAAARARGGAARRLLPAPRRRRQRVTFSSPPRAEEPGRREAAAAAAAAAAAGRQVTATSGVPGGERSAGPISISPSSPSHPFSLRSFPPPGDPGGKRREGRLVSSSRHAPGRRPRSRGRTREGGGRGESVAAGKAGCVRAARVRALAAAARGLACLPPAASRWSVDSLSLRRLGSRSRRSPRPLPQLLEGEVPGTAPSLPEAAGPVRPVALDASRRSPSGRAFLGQARDAGWPAASRHGGRPCPVALGLSPARLGPRFPVPGCSAPGFCFPSDPWSVILCEGRRAKQGARSLKSPLPGNPNLPARSGVGAEDR